MNPALTHIAARSHYQDLLRAAQPGHPVESVRRHRRFGLARTITSMRFNRRNRSLAIRTAAVS